jgi:hypothetical protein
MPAIGYADPPYIGQAKKHYSEHPDYAGEVDHRELLIALQSFEGWVLHCSSTSLPQILRMAEEEEIGGYRIMPWVKPFCAFKRNVSVAYAWEPVLVKPVRKPEVHHRVVMRDWFSHSMMMKKGLTGAKPPAVCRWLFEMVGAYPDDELVDLFPGTGIVKATWDEWREEVRNGSDDGETVPEVPVPQDQGAAHAEG